LKQGYSFKVHIYSFLHKVIFLTVVKGDRNGFFALDNFGNKCLLKKQNKINLKNTKGFAYCYSIKKGILLCAIEKNTAQHIIDSLNNNISILVEKYIPNVVLVLKVNYFDNQKPLERAVYKKIKEQFKNEKIVCKKLF